MPKLGFFHYLNFYKETIGYRMSSKFRFFYKEFKNKEFNLLDVGCGNHSPKITKLWFPKVKYYGIDREFYNLDDDDIGITEKFYKKDLEKESLEDIPDNFFDIVILSHIIEHLSNGSEVLREITKKVKSGGYIYIEYPSVKSLNLPSMRGTLHFCDDSTHKKLYNLIDIANILLSENFVIIKAGARRIWLRIFLLPIIMAYMLLTKKPIAGVFWDLLGFAEFCYAKKKER